MTIQAKTTILFTALTLGVFLILSGVVYYFSNQFVYNDFHKRLELRARIAVAFRFDEHHVSTEAFKHIKEQYLEKLPSERTLLVKLSPTNRPEPPAPGGLTYGYLQQVVDAAGKTVFYQRGSSHYAGIFRRAEEGGFLVIESAENVYGSEIMNRLRNILIVAIIAAAALIYFVGRYFSKRTFAPFRYITRKVQLINEVNLHERLEEQENSDEVSELVVMFNDMLGRLEAIFATQNNFIGHASHELRTPLSVISAEAEYALSGPRVESEYRDSLQRISKQAIKLQELTKGLLSFAQVKFNGKKMMIEPLRADELLFELKADIDSIYPGRLSLILDSMPDDEQKLYINGNAALLKISIGNLILNSCKYSGDKPVDVELRSDNGYINIRISDQGIGIPAEDIGHIYEPFFRASNVAAFEGFGLGIPLSHTIFRLHQGSMAVDSQLNSGTSVNVRLPVRKTF